MVKQFFEYETIKLNGVSDGSFARYVVTIKKGTFYKLLLSLYGDSDKAEEIKEKANIKDKESLIREFVREFGKSFARESSKRTAEALFDVISPVSFLKRLFGYE